MTVRTWISWPYDTESCRVFAPSLLNARDCRASEKQNDVTSHINDRFRRSCYLEECVSGVKLKHNAADAPYVTRLRPTQLEDDFRCAVVTRRHDRAVVFVVERRRSEVDELNL